MNEAVSLPRLADPLADSALFRHLPGDISLSFEFFPPKDDAAEGQMWRAYEQLAAISPEFVSMTYGAGGSTRARSLAAVRRMVGEGTVPVAAHLTCVGASRDEVDQVALDFWDAGIRHIVALRGDGGKPGEPFVAHPDGYGDAAQLVAGLSALKPFEISVAAYPEVHPDAADEYSDLDHLKRKLDAGASRAITQFFFAPDTFLRFRDKAAAAGIDAPIVPGVLPISNFGQASRFAAACGASIPGWMEALFEGLDKRPAARQFVAMAVTAELTRRLYDEGVREFHFYTLNRAELTEAVCHLLGRKPPGAEEVAT